ncbi:MAG: hypothetical protein IJZ36_00970 [Bacilli bacterium]|nr:hypothetical protein [Bacilli bacterium]
MKKINIFSILITLIVIYLILYFANITGYYEYTNYNKTTLTNEQIKKFEEDIKMGNNIDINDYVVKKIDYQNKISKFNKEVSKTVNKVFKNFIQKTLGYLNKIVD